MTDDPYKRSPQELKEMALDELLDSLPLVPRWIRTIPTLWFRRRSDCQLPPYQQILATTTICCDPNSETTPTRAMAAV